MGFPIAIRLAVRQWRARPLRPILCSLAIAAAVALIICVGVAMDSLRYSLSAAIGDMLGVAEVHVRPTQKGTESRLPQSLLERVRALPEVELAAGRLTSNAGLKEGDDRKWLEVVGIDQAMDDHLRPKKYVAGSPQGALGPDEIIIDTNVARDLKLGLGDHVAYTVDGTTVRQVRVAAIIGRPALELLARPSIFASREALSRDMGIADQYSVLDIKLRESAGIEDYDQYAAELGKTLGPSVEVLPGTSSKARLTDMTRTLSLMLVLLSVIAALCAALIIGTTLSVGVQERVRQFGQLRCIGASRGQLASFLLGDALVMMVIGLGLGILLGTGISAILVAWFPQLFLGFRMSGPSLMTAGLCGCLATLLGAAIPMWQVARVPPMAAVTAVGQPPSRRYVGLAALAGVACLGLQALLWNVIPSREWKFYTELAVGNPLIFAGWALLAPLILILMERMGAEVLGRLMRVRPALLRSAWSRTPWRAGAMIAALMIGVMLFTVVRARGASLMASWESPAQVPDLILKTFGTGFSQQRVDQLRQKHPELRDISPFEAPEVSLSSAIFRIGSILKKNDTTFVAVDPEAFTRLIHLDYVQGEQADAVRKMQQGGYILITKEFHNVRGLSVGDKLTLNDADGKPVDFTVAGVVSATGVELVKNYFDLRTGFNEKSISSVLGSIADGRKYFHMGDPSMALANVEPGSLTRAHVTELREALAREGFQTVSSVELKTSILGMIQRVISALTVIAIGALCVASLGVANMVIASIHAKRYEFGVLRAVGAGRGQLVRLVLAEVSLIGGVAGLLGAAAGLHFAFMATQLDLLVLGFPMKFLAADGLQAAGLAAGFIVLAVGLTTALAWLASLAPAIQGAMTAQRTLLASGRA